MQGIASAALQQPLMHTLEVFGVFIVLVLSVTVKAASSIYAPCKAVLGCRANKYWLL